MESPRLEMRYFVLNPNKDTLHGHASREAIRRYCQVIGTEGGKEQMAFISDLLGWLGRIRETIDAQRAVTDD
jgi:hypothetical protein